MKCGSTARGFVSGTSSVYQKFWEDRDADLRAYPPKEQREITNYLNQQVFGALFTGEDSSEDHEMQEAFNHAIRQEISARARRRGNEEQEQTGDGSEGTEDKGEGSSRNAGKQKESQGD